MESLWLSVHHGVRRAMATGIWLGECLLCVLVLRQKLAGSVRILTVAPRASCSKGGLYFDLFLTLISQLAHNSVGKGCYK